MGKSIEVNLQYIEGTTKDEDIPSTIYVNLVGPQIYKGLVHMGLGGEI